MKANYILTELFTEMCHCCKQNDKNISNFCSFRSAFSTIKCYWLGFAFTPTLTESSTPQSYLVTLAATSEAFFASTAKQLSRGNACPWKGSPWYFLALPCPLQLSLVLSKTHWSSLTFPGPLYPSLPSLPNPHWPSLTLPGPLQFFLGSLPLPPLPGPLHPTLTLSTLP